MLKQPNFFYSQPSTLPKDAPAKFLPFYKTFGLGFMISSIAPSRLSTSYAYLITKMGNRNLKGFENFPEIHHQFTRMSVNMCQFYWVKFHLRK